MRIERSHAVDEKTCDGRGLASFLGFDPMVESMSVAGGRVSEWLQMSKNKKYLWLERLYFCRYRVYPQLGFTLPSFVSPMEERTRRLRARGCGN